MKKLLLTMLALSLVAGFSVSASADDMVDFSGSMMVYGFYNENFSDWDSSYDTDQDQYWWQRFRLYTKITPAEGVSAHLRTDFGERNWGNSGDAFGRPESNGSTHTGATIHVDRAFLDISKEFFTFRAGQQYTAWGLMNTMEPQFTGLLLNLKFPVTVDLLYAKYTEQGQSDEEEDTDNPKDGVDDDDSEDDTTYGLQVGYASDTFTIKTFYATSRDETALDLDDDLWVWGLWTKLSMGMFTLGFELNVFGGEIETAPGTRDIDYEGVQAYLLLGFKFSEMFNMEFEIIYAQGTDEGRGAAIQDEVQATALHQFGGWTPTALWNFDTDYTTLPGYVTDPDSGLEDPETGDGGVIALIISADFAVTENFKIYSQIGYAEIEEEDLRGQVYEKLWEDSWWIAVSTEWKFMEAVTWNVGLYYADISLSNDEHWNEPDGTAREDDSAWGLITALIVDF